MFGKRDSPGFLKEEPLRGVATTTTTSGRRPGLRIH